MHEVGGNEKTIKARERTMAEQEGRGWARLLCGAAAVAVLCLPGCGREAHVSGTVTLDNAPVSGALVVLIGEDEQNKAPVVAQTDDQGKYRLVGHRRGGILPGKYKAVVTKMALADGTVPQGEKLEQARSQGLLLNVLPPAYEDRATTPLAFDVSGGSQTINLELKRKS
jgi:hypothetical protein